MSKSNITDKQILANFGGDSDEDEDPNKNQIFEYKDINP